MNVTIDIKIMAIVVIVIAVIVLTVYLVQLIKKLMVTLDHTNKILADASVVSEIAAARSQDVDGIITNVSESVAEISDAVKGDKSIFAAVSSVFKSIVAIKKAIDKKDDK